jgi:hypothetical protein
VKFCSILLQNVTALSVNFGKVISDVSFHANKSEMIAFANTQKETSKRCVFTTRLENRRQNNLHCS